MRELQTEFNKEDRVWFAQIFQKTEFPVATKLQHTFNYLPKNQFLQTVKISYCIPCKGEFDSMESADDHVRFTKHEVMKEKPGGWI